MGQLLVAQQRLDAGVLELGQRPLPGVGHRQPRGLQRGQQPGGGVRVHRRLAERRPDLRQQPLQLRRPLPGHRPGAEQVAEQPVVHVGPPRHPGVLQLRGDQRAGGLRGQQQPQPAPLGARGQRRLLTGQLGQRVEPVGRVVEGEQRRLVGRRRGQGVPALGVRTDQQVLVDVRRPAQHRVAQPQVGAALHPHPGGQQARVPAGGVVPHPPGPVGLAGGDEARQVLPRQPGDGAAVPVVGLDDVAPAQEDDGPQHPPSVAEGSDSAARTVTAQVSLPGHLVRPGTVVPDAAPAEGDP
ncbi:unannotated protein [freshwater metagenome]|uniref:Unannotated protein n=1 Tax=freshwater metagenome TaxID=449393 RepID=A0A6J7H6Z4_9ZZZZ